ncbi:MAG TPA: hypothetical protein VFY16_09750 [Gemmatimonadaceae bacterium]|nr:hypothetical protein [Gemmatimonadaceae bacterium]
MGPGGLLPRLHGVAIVQVTDGAPRQRAWWDAPELSTRAAYARVRRTELLRALALAGVDEARLHSLDVPDQEASLDLAGLAERIADVLGERQPADGAGAPLSRSGRLGPGASARRRHDPRRRRVREERAARAPEPSIVASDAAVQAHDVTSHPAPYFSPEIPAT